ncbi:MAG: hypothetical protein ABGW69_02735 [Nanoarchaeota archaeon]
MEEKKLDNKKLFEVWRKQSNNKHKVIELDENFYEQLAELIKNLENEIKELKNLEFEDAESFEKLFLRKEKALLEIKKITERIFKIRTFLILNLAFKYSEGDIPKIKGLTKEEQKFFVELAKLIKDYKVKVLKKVIKGEKPEYNNNEEENEENEYWIVASKSYIPQFIGSDFKIYGPFEPEEVFSVPKDTALVLLKKDKIKIITKVK